jgi:hypothetical protein
MAITPNYSWPLPDDTDLVKDGAEAIRDLGNAIDTTVDGLGVGLVHINTTTFSAVASQSINDVFSSTYDAYRFIFWGTGSTTTTLRMRLRVGGADNSTASSYLSQNVTFDGSSVTAGRAAAGNQADLAVVASSLKLNVVSDIFDPFKAEPTVWTTTNSASKPTTALYLWAVTHNQSVSYDGFTIYPDSGTITGTISIYGYRK